MHIRTLGIPALVGTLLSTMIPTPAAAATAGFGPPVDVPTGGIPVATATGDLNGDGRPDLAVANDRAGSVSILLSRRAAGFRTMPEVVVGGTSSSVAIADVTGDRRPDLISTAFDADTHRIVVAPGRGDGRFRAPRVIDLGAGALPLRVVAADLDGDADVDLAVTLASQLRIQVLGNDGRGRFTPGAVLDASPNVTDGLTTGDLNRDGHLDLLATGGPYGRVVAYLGTGDGSFGPGLRRELNDSVNPAVLADYTSDGLLDLITPFTWGDALLLPGNGDGTFGEARYLFVSRTVAATAGDFDGDGRADVAFSGGYSGAVVLLGNGDGTFQEQLQLTAPGDPGVPAAADFTGDGRDDLIVPNVNGLTFTARFFPTTG